MTTMAAYSPLRPSFWSAYFVTLRPYLLFVSGASGLLGLALGEAMGTGSLLAALVAFSLTYGLGQATTDVFQTDTDAISSPYRPLVRGEITGRSVLAVSLCGLVACVGVLALLSPATLVLGAAGIVGLLLYTPAKRRFWAGPFWNSWIVGLLPAMGLLCASRSVGAALAHPGLSVAVLSTLFTYSLFVLLGYFKDIEADRATGYETLPVRFGRSVSIIVSGVLCLAGLASSVLLLNVCGARFAASVGLALWTAGALSLVLAHVQMLPVTRDEDAHPAIATVVRGYVLLHLGEVALLRAELWLLALVFYALFEVALARRPCRSQI
jgi:4-hydroxybenzoate polyprenyltransferase